MSSISTSAKWSVQRDGKQVELLKKKLPLGAEAADELILETSKILELCGSPQAVECAETGLVLGYVQSGKTMSFTTLIAMARDNGYQVVIVLAGTQNVLVDQSVKRLNKDLQIEDNVRDWRILPNPEIESSLDNIRSTLREYKRASVERKRQRTTIVAVTKNPVQLGKLCAVVELLREEFKGVPTLIVDDEADQAGLNNEAYNNRARVANGEPEEQTTVYATLLRLKKALPHHTYVQYTATPQALLFISRNDDFSPNFIKLLTPGSDYTGGETFFRPPQLNRLVIEIPAEEVYSRKQYIAAAPESLKEALRVFFLGAADFLIKDESGNRSMMVHPSQFREIHKRYYDWVKDLQSTWERRLEMPENDPSRQSLIAEFRSTYNDLQDPSSDLASFEKLVEFLHDAVSSTQVKLLNAAHGSAPKIEWKSNEFFILVGGQAMSRGYTVEGLTVTYMPRGTGTGAADSLQQWARFFGYKKSYLHLCRVYLLEEVIRAFSGYVAHEDDLRTRLQAHDAARTLKDFARIVKLPFSIKQLTRKSVLSDDLERFRFSSGARENRPIRGVRGNWTTTVTVQGTENEIERNRLAIQTFIDKQGDAWRPDKGSDDRTDYQMHRMAEVPLGDIVSLLRDYGYLSTDDTSTFEMLANSLARYVGGNADAKGTAFEMSSGKLRTRTAPVGKLTRGALFQGANPARDGGEGTYEGDYFICSEHEISIQIHFLFVTDESGHEFETFALAVWVPATEPMDMVKLAND